MKTLFENLLDVASTEADTNVIKYLSYKEFQELYKRKLKSIDIDDNNPVCIIGGNDAMEELCDDFKAKNINMSRIYPESKIKSVFGFAANCKNLIDFKGPNKHENYSEIESLERLFYSDDKLKTFDLIGIAESVNKIQIISHMFNSCYSIEYIDLSNFNFSKLSLANNTFISCVNLKQIDLGDSSASVEANDMCMWDINLKEFNAPNMILSGRNIFSNCKSLKHINVKYIDVSNEYYNIFDKCTKLENVNIFGFGKNTETNNDYIDLSWAVSLSDKSWDFLFKNLSMGNNTKIKLPDTAKKEKLIEKYESIAKQYDFELV